MSRDVPVNGNPLVFGALDLDVVDPAVAPWDLVAPFTPAVGFVIGATGVYCACAAEVGVAVA
jgi:hypothetical protein